MSELVSRRKLIVGGAAVAGATALAVAGRIAEQYGLIPPDSGGIYGAGETLTYAAQRILTSGHSLAREFSRSDISKVIPVSGDPPKQDLYQRLRAGNFTDWRLRLDGLVARPASFSLVDLKNYPATTQITHQACEEGWSFIAEWSGVRLSQVLNLAGLHPNSKYVVFYSHDDSYESLDMADALHPQTLLVLGMNGRELSAPHGAPVRLRVPRQLGYKSLKFLSRISVTDSVKNIGKGFGSSAPEAGYSWYAGI